MRPAPVLLAALVLAGCGDTTSDASEAPGPTSLTLTLADGAVVDLDRRLVVRCDPDEDDANRTVVRVYTDTKDRSATFFMFEVDPTIVGPDGRDYDLPYGPGYTDPEGMVFFVADGNNELSAAEEEASGTLHVITATCDPVPHVELTADVTLGSELGLPSARVSGGIDVSGG